MPTPAEQLFHHYLQLARRAYRQRDYQQALLLLETVHVLGQTHFWRHLQSHGWMLKAGWRAQDLTEVGGQLWRLLLTPLGHLTNRLPLGNTGRARVSAFAPMPLSPALRQQMAEQATEHTTEHSQINRQTPAD